MKTLLEWDADETAVDVEGMTVLDLAEHMDDGPSDFDDEDYDDDAVDQFTFPGLKDVVRRVVARAPRERKDRVWRRRRLLVLWRAYPDRFQAVEESCKASADRTQPRALRRTEPRIIRSRVQSVVQGRVEGAGAAGRRGKGGGVVGVLAARVAGIEEEGIFRSIVTFL